MNLNLPPDLKFCECLIKPFTFDVSKASIVRITLWCLFFLLLAHFLAPKVRDYLPYEDDMKESGIYPVMTSLSDARYTEDIPFIYTARGYRVYWVSGSSSALQREDGSYDFLPADVKEFMPKGTRMNLSLRMARRALDTYTMSLDALQRRPSKLVIALNPYWVFNEQSIFFKTNLMNKGAQLWPKSGSWGLHALLSSPGNMLWAGLGRHHNILSDSYNYLKKAQEMISGPPKKKKIKVAAHNNTQPNFAKNPSIFWAVKRSGKDFSEFDLSEELFLSQIDQETLWSESLLKNLIRLINEKETPTLFYLAPINLKNDNPDVQDSYEAIKEKLARIFKENSSEHVRYIDSFDRSVINSLTFRDHIHLKDSGKLPKHLADEIATLGDKP